MAEINGKAKSIINKLNNLEKNVLIGTAYPLGNSGSIFTGMGKSFKTKGVVTGKAIAFKKNGFWYVIQG